MDNRAMADAVERCVIGTSAIRPSIETMLHAALPFKYVEHTHADSILAVANVEDGERVLAEVYGELAPTVGYHDSGVELARACLEAFERRGTERTIGLILRFHGAVAFGDSARASYENMLRLAAMAEDFLKSRNAWEIPLETPAPAPVDEDALSALQAEVSKVAGRPLAMHCARDPLSLAFARRDDLDTVSQAGPATPQHAFFTKRVPLIGRDVAGYARRYRDYLERHLGDAAADGHGRRAAHRARSRAGTLRFRRRCRSRRNGGRSLPPRHRDHFPGERPRRLSLGAGGRGRPRRDGIRRTYQDDAA